MPYVCTRPDGDVIVGLWETFGNGCATPSIGVAPLRVTASDGRFSALCSLGNKKIRAASERTAALLR